MNFNLVFPQNFVIDIGPNLQKLGAKLMGVLDDLKDEMTEKFSDLQAAGSQAQDTIVAAINAEHDQVMAKLTDLQNQLSNNVGTTADVQVLRDNMNNLFNATKTDLDNKKNAIIAAVNTVYEVE